MGLLQILGIVDETYDEEVCRLRDKAVEKYLEEHPGKVHLHMDDIEDQYQREVEREWKKR